MKIDRPRENETVSPSLLYVTFNGTKKRATAGTELVSNVDEIIQTATDYPATTGRHGG